MADASASFLPYHEPSIATILLNSSFLLLLNIVNFFLDKTLYCGLLGQVFIGVAFGTPGGKWLGTEVEQVIAQLGYLGLLLLVFEGGLSTSFKALRANLFLSVGIAFTGIAAPMCLSFVLLRLAGATPLQAFAAGAALCSTSLGTTFTVLGTSGLTSSRLGVALTSAAMMDDVVGLVMVQIISNLGGQTTSISATTIIRPALVSVAFAVVTPLVCRFIVKPLTVMLNDKRSMNRSGYLYKMFSKRSTLFVVHTLILVGLIAGSTYAGSSNLFASYIAGAAISWWDTELPHVESMSAAKAKKVEKKTNEANVQAETSFAEPQQEHEASSPARGECAMNAPKEHFSGLEIYHTYYHQPLERILKPLFFASIGFSIPITQMFSGSIVWRGIIYTILMVFGKLLCGLWLIRISLTPYIPDKVKSRAKAIRLPRLPHFWGTSDRKQDTTTPASRSQQQEGPAQGNNAASSASLDQRSLNGNPSTEQNITPSPTDHVSPNPRKPVSLYPASILGGAMVARGEIGFLISSIAESNGIFSSGANTTSGASPIFLIVTWAIVMCTIIGPLCVGLLVRRVKKLQEGMEKEGRVVRTDVLGVWGVS